MQQETTVKSRKLGDLYKDYPYKKPHENGITRPLLGKNVDYVTNHKLSMTWRQWHEFMKIYFKYLKLYLLSGNQVVLPHHMGVMQMHKKKSTKLSVDWNKFHTTGEYTHHKNHHTGGYSVGFKWYRNKHEAKIKNKFQWAAVLNRTFKSQIAKTIKNKPTLLMSYSIPSYSKKVKEAIKPI